MKKNVEVNTLWECRPTIIKEKINILQELSEHYEKKIMN